MSALFGWLFVWGDRHAPPMELIYPVTALFAAAISLLTSVRLIKDRATIGYLSVVVVLTAILIVFAIPYWLARLLR